MNKCGSWLLLAVAAVLPGCTVLPVTEWNATQAQNRALAEQNRAQLAEIDNLQAHCRTVEDRLLRDEKQLAALQERAVADRRESEDYRRKRDGLDGSFQGTGVDAPVAGGSETPLSVYGAGSRR